MSSVADCPSADCPMRTETKPLRSYLDRILYGAVALVLLWAGTRLDSYGEKLEANTSELVALRERLDGLKERVAMNETRLFRVELMVQESRTKEDRRGN